MSFLIKKASRKQAKMRVGIFGASGCLSKNTIINVNMGECGRKYSIAKLYNTFRQSHTSGRPLINEVFTRQYDYINKTIHLGRIYDVVYSGKKQLFKIVLENGYFIEATEDHRFYSEEGFKKLKEINIGDFLCCDNFRPIKNKSSNQKLRENKVTGLIFHKYARLITPKRNRSPFKEVELHRAIYEADTNNLTLDDYKHILKTDESKSASLILINPDKYHIHHIDKNHQNNRISNLACLTIDEHKNIHKDDFKKNLNTVFYSKVIKIERTIIDDTYDIKCFHPFNNFVANGFVVHNSGKTYSSLLLANGLIGEWSKIVVIDTENNSADLYSHLGDYSTLTLEAPFSPQRYIEAIKGCEAAGFELIIIDSISHEWEGLGGCLDIHSKLGGKFEQWAKVTPLHRRFIDTIVQSKCHVITCGRSKIDYAFEGKSDSNNGKGRVEKVGLKTITREGFDYELTLAFNVNQEHFASIDKDRTSIFKDTFPFLITPETGKKIREWNEAGEKEDLRPVIKKEIISLITERINGGGDKDALLKELGISSSKEILSEDRIENLNDWLAILK